MESNNSNGQDEIHITQACVVMLRFVTKLCVISFYAPNLWKTIKT